MNEQNWRKYTLTNKKKKFNYVTKILSNIIWRNNLSSIAKLAINGVNFSVTNDISAES